MRNKKAKLLRSQCTGIATEYVNSEHPKEKPHVIYDILKDRLGRPIKDAKGDLIKNYVEVVTKKLHPDCARFKYKQLKLCS